MLLYPAADVCQLFSIVPPCQCGRTSGPAEEYAQRAAVFQGTVIGINRLPHLLFRMRLILANVFSTLDDTLPYDYGLYGAG